MTRIHGTSIAAALALSAVVLSAGAPQQASPQQEPVPPPAPAQPAPPAQPARPASPAQQPSFRVGVELVSMNVTVTDAANRYVTDLDQGDFQVYEDGVKQEVTLFNRTNLPIALALLLDTSASMEARLPIAQEAAIGFSRRLRPQDLA